ncbi:hypothetical protein ABZS76_33050 [Streptomyces sp. NPDC005562]|uniref:hypothetical protein n=1 Tax=Streptomyces sp. NPDC005562 TaxID=3154890 RepID=UPI0033BBFBD9
MALPVVVAHQSGDGITIAHCPFCGSGQVIGRSDGNTECSFCNQSFLVRVQPMYSAFPQSIDGMPVDIPGMPPSGAAGVPPGGGPAAEGGAPGPDGDDAGGAPPFGQDGAEGDSGGNNGPEASSGDDSGGPPFGKKESTFRTTSGRRLARASYVNYLAQQLELNR